LPSAKIFLLCLLLLSLGTPARGRPGAESPVEPLLSPPPFRVVLRWNPSPSPDIVAYRIYFGTVSGEPTEQYDLLLVDTSALTVTITDLRPNVVYYFTVTAWNDAGLESQPSNEVAVRTIGPYQPIYDPPAIRAASE
jgi:hypothetical protein